MNEKSESRIISTGLEASGLAVALREPEAGSPEADPAATGRGWAGRRKW